MPEYSCYYSTNAEEPVLTKRYIDDIRNLNVGDYLATEHSFNIGGVTKIYTIKKITNLFVFVDKFCEFTNETHEARLTWEEEDSRFYSRLSKGCLKNKKHNLTFYFFVKKNEINLERFTDAT